MVLPQEVDSVMEAGFFGSWIILEVSDEQEFGWESEGTFWIVLFHHILYQNSEYRPKLAEGLGRGKREKIENACDLV